MIPGIAALLLVRGCPEDRLEEAFTIMANGNWPMPSTPLQAVRDVDKAIGLLGHDDVIGIVDTTASGS